jgi:predicted RNA-binding Zn-ribbon protein involved in translation (DUF1610 family)
MAPKVYVSDNKRAMFVCPECGNAKNIDLSKQKGVYKAYRAKYKCHCGHSYPVLIEKRRYYRKKTNLQGMYTHIVTNSYEKINKGVVTITDISRSGIMLRLNTKHNLKVGDKLLIDFELDNTNKTKISKKVTIKHIDGLKIGARFCKTGPSDAGDKAIGFYMLK